VDVEEAVEDVEEAVVVGKHQLVVRVGTVIPELHR
jgi:hypothetical protein